MTTNQATFYDADKRELFCQGDFDLAHLPALESLLHALSLPSTGEITVDGSGIQKMDSAGAWLLANWQGRLEKKGLTVSLDKFPEKSQKLLAIVKKELSAEIPLPVVTTPTWVKKVGISTLYQLAELREYLSFVGMLALEMLRILKNPSKHLRLSSIASIIYSTGFQALPIIALLSFMIGVVITYQMGLQLRNYGANIYIVDLLGLSILREFSPLLTAIMVAGRSGSAFTAQLGMMKLNQEIDALDTMGVTPAELLLLPRIIGLFISLPLLTIWSDIFGVVGGMVMSNTMLHITWYDFLQRFPHVIPLKTLFIGLGKAPVFALIIASVGCFQGNRVEGTADSVGRNTTRSVVLAIFFIIVADAIFSILFSKLKL